MGTESDTGDCSEVHSEVCFEIDTESCTGNWIENNTGDCTDV